MASREQVARFIGSSFRSVWSLEVLLLLKRDPRPWTHEAIVAALRASDLIVTQSLDALAAAGLVAQDKGGAASYRPVSPSDAEMVEAAERFYLQSPDAVRRIILGTFASGLTEFADAFRLRKD